MRWNRRRSRLYRLLAEQEMENALREAGMPAGPVGGAGCGCFWEYLPEGHIRIWTCDAHAFICTPDGGT